MIVVGAYVNFFFCALGIFRSNYGLFLRLGREWGGRFELLKIEVGDFKLFLFLKINKNMFVFEFSNL